MLTYADVYVVSASLDGTVRAFDLVRYCNTSASHHIRYCNYRNLTTPAPACNFRYCCSS